MSMTSKKIYPHLLKAITEERIENKNIAKHPRPIRCNQQFSHIGHEEKAGSHFPAEV
jgi:hypothetical protein